MKLFKVAALAVAGLLIGCSGGSPMVGTWKMVFDPSMKDKVPAGMSLPEISMVFMADGTFNGTAESMGKKSTVKGTYKLEDSKLTMTMTEEDGKKSNKTENITLSADKKSFEIPNSGGMGKMVKQ